MPTTEITVFANASSSNYRVEQSDREILSTIQTEIHNKNLFRVTWKLFIVGSVNHSSEAKMFLSVLLL